MNYVLEIKGLTKKYDDFTLDNISLNLSGGCIMGFIGENGAGKSTTIKGPCRYSVKTMTRTSNC